MEALRLVILLCLNSGQDYHLCFESLVQCSNYRVESYMEEHWDAVRYCHETGKLIDEEFMNYERAI